MNSLTIRCRFVKRFLARFERFFSAKQMIYFSIYICALFRDMKRSSLEAIAREAFCNYENLQYFFSDSKWDVDQVNDARIALIEGQRTTASTKNGVLAIDDSSCPKIYAKKTEGADYQYCGAFGHEAVCNVFVSSAFVSENKHFPINYRFYKKRKEDEADESNTHPFKSKIQLAKELILDAIDKKINFEAVVVDSWYAHSSELVSFIDSHDHTLVGEAKSNRNILVYHPIERKSRYMKQGELVTLVREHYLDKIKPVRFVNYDGKAKSIKSYQFVGRFKNSKVPLKFVILFGPYGKKDQKKVHVLFTNRAMLSPQKIVSLYRLRWGIESCYRELKDFFMMDQYQVRSRKRIERHWTLCHVAWTLAYWVKKNGFLSKICNDNPTTLNEVRRAINNILVFQQIAKGNDSADYLARKLNIKSNRVHRCAG